MNEIKKIIKKTLSNVTKIVVLIFVSHILLSSCKSKLFISSLPKNTIDSTLSTTDISEVVVPTLKPLIHKFIYHAYSCIDVRNVNDILDFNQYATAYTFLNSKIKSIESLLSIQKHIKIIIHTDSTIPCFIDTTGFFYISKQKLNSFNHIGELMSFLMHECIHFTRKDRLFTLYEKIVEEKKCLDTSLFMKTKNIYLKTLLWKQKEKRTDSLVLTNLIALQVYPLAMVERFEKKLPLYNSECMQHQEERILKTHKNWIALGMPSFIYEKKNYALFKKLLNEK